MSTNAPPSPLRILLLLPDPEEADLVLSVLPDITTENHTCRDFDDLRCQIKQGAGTILIAEEALDTASTEELNKLRADNAAWSNIPLILFTNAKSLADSAPASALASSALVLQRPFPPLTLHSAINVAFLARQRQYLVRDLLSHRDSVLASINDSFIMLDKDWRFTYLNEKAAEMYGKPRERLIGENKWNVVTDITESGYRERIEKCARDQTELQIQYFHPPSQRWFEKRIYPSENGISMFATDITERKKTEDNLHYQLGIIRAITDNAADSLFLLDSEGCVTFMNPAAEQTFGWKIEDLTGKNLHDHVHVHRSRSARLDCPLHSIFTSGLNLRDVEDQFRCKNGSSLFVSCSNAPLFVDGDIAGSVLVVHDITYHKLAEQQLKALNENLELRVAERTAIAEQRASQLSALASELTQTEQRERRRLAHILHDNLQQILVATKLQVGMVRQKIEDDQTREALLHIEDLLTNSVEESRSLTVELSPPILYDAGLGRALEWLVRRMEQEHQLVVHLSTEPEAEPPGDDIRAFLFQAVREFLFNIVKHAGVREASVTLSRTRHNQALITIEDKGTGFDPNAIELQNTPDGGFGLFSIRERLEYLGGRLAIQSARGKGTSVSLSVPITDPSDNGSSSGESKRKTDTPKTRSGTRARKNGNVIRVLLADDHKMLRDGLAGLLSEQSDIEIVSEAADGQSALELAHKVQPDIVIMDVTMPRMNGVEATRRITQELPHIRVIGLSMHEKEDMATAMREAGAVAYVTKGAPSEILTAAIRDCMTGKHPRKASPPKARDLAKIET